MPVADEGKMLVADEYLQYLVEQANAKMETNWRRIEAFQTACQAAFQVNPPRIQHLRPLWSWSAWKDRLFFNLT